MKIPIRQYWALLKEYLRPQWRIVALLALTMVGGIAMQLVTPQIMRGFIDSAMAGEPMSTLFRSAGLFIGLSLLGQGLGVLDGYLSSTVSWTATNALRLDLMRHVMGLDQSYHKAHTSGELIERIDGDVDTLSGFFSHFVVQLMGNVLLLAGVMAILLRENLVVGAGVLGVTVLTLVVLIKIREIAVPYWKKQRELQAGYYGFLGERLGGMADIRANGAVDHVMQRLYQLNRERFMPNLKSGVAGYSMWLTNSMSSAIRWAVTFVLLYYAWQRGALTIGAAYMVFHYANLLWMPISQIRHHLTELQQAEAGMQRINEMLDTRTKLPDGDHELPGGALSLRVEDLTFGYEDGDGEVVLHDIDLALEPGRVLGLLGRTGSGKTTMARLLLRLYDPSEGRVLLGGVATTEARLRHLRQRVAMVTQSVELFKGTIRDNLTFFGTDVPDERLLEVLEELGLRSWLESLPDGLDTELDAGGGGLSAGQAQLLAFARVFLRDPGLVILDEASSRLDPATEALIERAVDKLLAGRTAVIIAHRLATVHRADEILIVDEGRMLEQGDRETLAMDPDSRFHHLLKTGLREVLA